MLKISFRYLTKNKKQTFTVIIGTILASVLLFSIGNLFSSFRKYLIEKTLEGADYHVKIEGNLDNYDDGDIASVKFKEDEYLIKYKNIKDTYENTDVICAKNNCQKTVYNVKLLSLYGIGDNNYLDLFKKLIVLIVFILSISVFFIIYNSFQISFSKKRKDIALFKLVGLNNSQLYRLFFIESILSGMLGIFIGFGLSLVLNLGIISLINNLLFEVLNGQLSLDVYIPFILIPLFFMIMIVCVSAIFPLFKIKKYKPMELFRESNLVEGGNGVFKNFILNYSYTNYKRGQKKYRSLIMCVFILIILFYSFMRFTSYTVEILNKYINIPEYDVGAKVNMEDYDKLNGLAEDLSSKKQSIFRSCHQEGTILGDSKNILVTDLGGNSVINLVREIVTENDKMIKKEYKPFSTLNEIVLDNGVRIDGIRLTDDIPFGMKEKLTSNTVILNLDKEMFDKVCLNYTGNLFADTDKNGLDRLIMDYVTANKIEKISYTNIKKGYELVNNLMLLIKIFMYVCVGIVCLISVFTILNIISANIKFRKKEFASLKSLGMTNFKISLCLFLESLIICGKGIVYSFPFVLLISNSLYQNIGRYFDVNIGIFGYELFGSGFVICLLLIFICMFISHLNLYRQSLIQNIKGNN